MHSDRLGWTFPPGNSDQPQPPDNPTIMAVGLLIRQEGMQAGSVSSSHRTELWYPVKLVSEVIGPRALGWLTSSLRGGRTSKQEPTNMPIKNDWKQQDDELEAQLVSIMANPSLAEEAFPDPHMREKVVPLFQNMRRRVESRETD